MQDSDGDPITFTLFNEIGIIEQLARTRLQRVMPKGLQVSHFSVLNHFARLGGEKSPAQLARAFQVTKSAMTNTIGKLEAAGHVSVRADAADGRRKLISLTPAGRAIRDRAVAAAAPIFADVTRRLGPEKFRAALPFLRDLRMVLDEKG
jgi:DNA-binding MarR family transcriptional regulator